MGEEGGACSTHWRDEKVLIRRPEVRDHLSSLGIDKWVVHRYIIKK